jgi:hypothetical protein
MRHHWSFQCPQLRGALSLVVRPRRKVVGPPANAHVMEPLRPTVKQQRPAGLFGSKEPMQPRFPLAMR